MKKFVLLASLIILLSLANPLEAKAACCRIIRYSLVDLPLLIDTPYTTVEEVANTQECLDTCTPSIWTGAVITYLTLVNPGVSLPIITASLANYRCQNFYYPSAKVDKSNMTCASDGAGCCEVIIDGDKYFSYAANGKPGENYATSECSLYCKAFANCTAKFLANHKPNINGKCQPVVSTSSSPGLQTLPPVVPGISGSGASAYTSLTNPLNSATIPSFISNVINWMLRIMGAIALAVFLYGGFMWLTAAGNDKKVATGKDAITWAAIGLACVFLSYIAVGYLLQVLGVI